MSRRQLDALLAESGEGLDAVDRAHLHEELGALLTLVDDAPPAPSPELAALLGLPAPGDAPPAVVALHRPGHPAHGSRRRLTGPRGAVTGAVVLAVATVGATGLSAAANSLPAPLQRQVADLSRTYLPFDFPEPRGAVGLPLPGAQPAPQPPVPDDAPGGATRQDARVPTPGREGTLPGPGSAAIDGPDETDPAQAPGSRAASTGPSPAPRPASTTRPQGDAAGPRGTSARPTRPARGDDASGSAGSTSDAPTAPRAGRPDASSPPLAMASPRPGRPGPSPSHGRPDEPGPAADEADGQADQGRADQGKGKPVPDDRGGRGDGKDDPGAAPSREPRPRGALDHLVDPVADRTLGGVAGSLGRD